MHLLVIEDERALCETIVRSLRRLAYSVDYCFDGEKALELLGTERYDLVLLDLNLPGKDGMTVLRTLRQADRETKVLILSARGEVEDKVEGLDAGANDYLAKPFHLAELEARIRSLTLRQFTQRDVLLTCGELTFDTRSRTASVRGQALALTRFLAGQLGHALGGAACRRGERIDLMPGVCAVEVDLARRLVVKEVDGDGVGVAIVAVHGENAAPLRMEETLCRLVADGVFLFPHRSKHDRTLLCFNSGSRAASCCGWGDGACAAPSPQSGGYARG